MTYKKIVAGEFGGPEKLKVVEEEVPEPGEGEVLVKMKAAGVSFADVMWLSGKVPGGPKVPFVPGYDMIGRVEKIGAGVEGFRVGDRVAGMVVYGGYAEYAIIPAAKLVKVPDGVNDTEAAGMLLNYLTAYQIYHRVARVTNRPGAKVLIHGAGGGVGSALLELGQIFGFTMYGTDSKDKEDVIRKFGGTLIDFKTEDFVKRIGELTEDGVDVAIDPVGGPHLLESFRSLRKGGMLVATASMASVWGKLSFLRTVIFYLSVFLWNYLPNGRSSTFLDIPVLNEKHPDWYREDLQKLFALQAEGKIKPLVAGVMPLGEAAKAHQMLLDWKVEGKLVLVAEG